MAEVITYSFKVASRRTGLLKSDKNETNKTKIKNLT